MLVALHRLTGEDRYRIAAEKSARWLAVRVDSTGKIQMAPHDRAAPILLESVRFGDIYYLMEALMFVAAWTDDPALLATMDGAFDRWIAGSAGLLSQTHNGYWWPTGDLWTASKMAGIPALLCERLRRPAPAALDEMVRHQLSWLDDDRLSRHIGVRASMASVSGDYALVATGFAGLSAAAGLRYLPEGAAVAPPVDEWRSLRPARGFTVPELADTAYLSPGNRRRKLPVHFDNAGKGSFVPKTVRIGAQWRAPGYAWFDGNVRDGFVEGEPNLLWASYTEGDDATMVVAVDPPDSLYTITVGLGDPGHARGPMDVVANDSLVATAIVTAIGEHRDITFRARAKAGRLAVRLRAASCAGFSITDMNIEGPSPSWLGFLFAPAAPIPYLVPESSSLPPATPEMTRRLLRRMAGFLVDQQPNGGGWSSWGLWYQTAFAVRGILSAGIVLSEPSWREAAFTVIDRFAAEQHASGSWSAGYSGADSCLTPETPDTSSTNLADVGSMALVLSLAAPEASAERRERWLTAARRYADAIILPEQLADGAFPNRKWMGRDYRGPYSVATATQCSNLMVLGSVTQDVRYTMAAERAAAWLSGTILEDGRVALHPHDSPNQKILDSTKFGDLFYIIEALVWTRDLTRDTRLRQRCQAAIDRWLTGTKGIKSHALGGYWWPPMDLWASSKMAGVPWILAREPNRGGKPIIDNWLDRSIGWLSDPDRAHLIGVGAHPSSNKGDYSLTATGFAAMGLASALDPGVLRPAAR
ncbi:MAG: hypothetical protein FD129_411 [bacterium]|nr:MAG: hypothetical protein FD129_411 [bacterium]